MDKVTFSGVIFALIVIWLFVCGLTYLVTSIQFHIGDVKNNGLAGQKALTVPYWIPYIGSVPAMLNQHRLYTSLASLPQSKRPLRLKLGPESIYLMLGPDNVRQIYLRLKELSMSGKVQDFMHYNLIPAEDYQVFASDRSGDLAQPAIDISPEKRVFHNTVKVFERGLTAPAESNAVALKFQQTFSERLRAFDEFGYFTVSLYNYLQKEMLIASGIALNGEELFRQNPSWHALYWKYDKYFLILSLNLPRWLVTGVYKARDEFVESVRKWYRSSHQINNLEDASCVDQIWEPAWGSRFWRKLIINFRQAGMSIKGIASPSAGILWALHSNAIPATAWLLFEILQDRLLFAEIMSEICSVVTSNVELNFDIKRLLELPVLNSAYREVLRLRISLIIYREAVQDLDINGTYIPKGARLLTPSWPAHTHPETWAPITDCYSPHYTEKKRRHTTLPADKFDPYRFLIMQDIKKNPLTPKPFKDHIASAFSQQNFFPWGGGSHICAGRNFAKQEILIAAATMLVKYDMQVLGWEKVREDWPEIKADDPARSHNDTRVSMWVERPARSDVSYAGGAVMPPDRDLRVRLRRKPMMTTRM